MTPRPNSVPLPQRRKHSGCGKKIQREPRRRPYPCWPQALRAVRAWLAPIHWLTRCWQAFSDKPPPEPLAQLMSALKDGQGINLYLST
jgi:hypothetical protein